MSSEELELSERLKLQTQLSRAVGSLEIEAVYAVQNKLQGGGLVPAQGEAATQASSHTTPVVVPPAPPGVDIDWNIRRALVSVSFVWFIERLAPDGEMDYKKYGNQKYEDFGNFNYGAVALAFGLTENAALRGAGLVQIIADVSRKLFKGKVGDAVEYVYDHGLDVLGRPPYGDSREDQIMIKNGFRYAREVFAKKYAPYELRHDYDMMRENVDMQEWDSLSRIPERVWDAHRYFKLNR